MEIIFLLAMMFIVAAILILIHPTPNDMKALHEHMKSNRSLKAAATQKKQSRFSKLFSQTEAMLQATKKGSVYTVLFQSVCLSAALAFLALLLDNVFLMPAFIVIGFLIPILKVKIYYIHYQNLLLDELEPSMNAITVSYERSDNILQAFEENLPYIQYPIRSVFEEFVYTVKHVNPNVSKAIDEMKTKIDHSVFTEWCDALKHCSTNHTLKYTLSPIVKKLTEIKVIAGELKNILYSSLRTYYVMLALTIILMAVSLFLFPMMLDIKLPDLVVHILIAIDVACMFFATWKVYLETKSIKTDV